MVVVQCSMDVLGVSEQALKRFLNLSFISVVKLADENFPDSARV